MASVTYNNIWKWILVDWTVLHNYYGDDFNPTNPDFPSSWSSVSAYQETTNFNLSWFQPWHEVWCSVCVIGLDWYSWRLYGDFIRDWRIWWTYYWDIGWWSSTKRSVYMYFWIDKDEIRPWYSEYQVHYYTVDWTVDSYSPTFRVSNLSIDSSYHKSWYMRIDWQHLCYTDNTWEESWRDGYWFKHKIAYDSSYQESVWTDKAWYIWLWDSLAIYYVDEYWMKRRTYPSRERYWWSSRPWTSHTWETWVWEWSAEYWYGHLCFVNSNWESRRILNWPPWWIY